MLGLDINAGYTWLDSKVKRGREGIYGNDGVEIDFTGEAFPLTPEGQGFADVGNSWEHSSGLLPFIGTTVTYRGATNGSFGGDPRYAIPSYTLVALRAGVGAADGSWRVWLWGKNVTDEYYWTNVDRIGDTSARFAGRPVLFGVSASFDW